MIDFKDILWSTGSNTNITFNSILDICRSHISNKSKIFIGTDSSIIAGKIKFASAICLHGSDRLSRYFFYKEKIPVKRFPSLALRITEETRRSVTIAEMLLENKNILPENIEIHLDVSPFSSNNATSKFSGMLEGYVNGYGLEYKIKPDAWASQSIADKHSK